MYKFFKLERDNNNYHIFKKKAFDGRRKFKDDHIRAAFKYAAGVADGDKEAFIKAFQGKMSTYGCYDYLSEEGIGVNLAQVADTPHAYACQAQGKHLGVLSTIYYGNLLLLETKDWNKKGQYVPNLVLGHDPYDYLVLVRLKPSLDNILRKNPSYFEGDIHDLLDKLLEEQWAYDFLGYVSREDLKYIIKEKLILPRHGMLNGKTKMDTDYYYVQGNNMRPMEALLRALKDQ